MGEDNETTYSIGQLAKAAGTTPRTVHYYQAQGLLPAAGTRGRYAVYNQTHLDRLRLIQQLKRAYLPLAAIRAQVDRLTPEQIRLLVEHDVHVIPEDAAEAAGYVAELLERRRSLSESTVATRPRALWVGSRQNSAVDGTETEYRLETRSEEAVPPARWERHVIAPGVELHVLEGARHEEIAAKVRAVRDLFQDGA
jgi:DNA-binding transcriptional MerR regulator